MKAFLLSAGYGERLKPLTDKIPKPLIEIFGIPLICYSIAMIKEAGIKDVICNLHYKYDEIIDFFKANNFFGLNMLFSIEDEILGTGGGLKKCEGMLSGSNFAVVNSDIITDLDLGFVCKLFQEENSPGMTILCNPTNGVPTVSVDKYFVADFKNDLNSGIKPEYEFSGISVLSASIFKYLSSDFSSVVYTGFTGLIKNESLSYYIHEGFWQDIGTIESLEKTKTIPSDIKDGIVDRVIRYIK
jgi:mannose-1-phosphate guanylyltransferase